MNWLKNSTTVCKGYRTSRIGMISGEELHDMINDNNNFVLLDVRAPMEYEDSHIKGSVNIPVADLRTRYDELDKDKTHGSYLQFG